MSNFIKQNNVWIIKISSQSRFLALTQPITLVKKLFEICNRCQTTVFSLFSLIVVLALNWKNISFPNRNGQEVSEVNNGLANYPQTTIALTDLHISILYHLVKSLFHKKKLGVSHLYLVSYHMVMVIGIRYQHMLKCQMQQGDIKGRKEKVDKRF